MEIDYQVTLNYGEDGPAADEPNPTEEDICNWIAAGMERAGLEWVKVTVTRQ